MKNLRVLKKGTTLVFFLIFLPSLLLFSLEGFSATDFISDKEINSFKLKESLKYADAQMWDDAYDLVKTSNSPHLRSLLDWLRLRAGDGNISEYIDFLNSKEDWPGMPLLAERGERKLEYGRDSDVILEYFKSSFPKTGHGSLVLAKALMLLDKPLDAQKVAKISWLDQRFSNKDFSLMLENFEKTLSKTHLLRVENLLWNKEKTAVLQMKEVVPKNEFLSAVKRLELQDGLKASEQGVNFSEQDQSNPGLLLDQSNVIQKQKKYKDVVKILRKVSRSSEFLGNPQKWKKLRVYHARRALRLGNYELAYELASQHFIEPENLINRRVQRVRQDYVELEFLAGFISINFLKKPKRALKHFARSIKLVKKEINVSKSYYWYARSLYELNQPTEAKAAFLVASKYLSTFYGQLAAERINTKDLTLDVIEKHKINCDKAKLMENEILKTGVLLLNADRIVLGVRFFKHLAETLSIDDRVCLVKFLHNSGNWSGVIGITKKFLLKDQSVIQFGYPVLHSIKDDLEGQPPLIHAIIRQESEFYSGARSSAGALGLMQIMPNTAKYLARSMGLKYDKRRMLTDEVYNIRLGTKYVQELLKSFRGSLVLSIAAYNAGPGSVKRWIKSYGDPRRMGIDPLVWIEMIPYDETRNYVSRVLSNELVYRSILGKVPLKFDRGKKNFGHKF